MAEPTPITSLEELADLALSTKHVIIDFWAEWCPPCKAIGPLFSKLSKEYSVPGQLAFAKVDVDANQDIAESYGVTAMPSFIILVDGEPNGVDVSKGKQLGGGAVMEGEKLIMIRGADPRNLTLVAAELGEAAKKAAGTATGTEEESSS